MTLKLSFGGTSFNLVVSSPEMNASLVSTNFIPNSNSNNGKDRDAVIDLNQFTGKLYISHASNATNERIKEEPQSALQASSVLNEIDDMPITPIENKETKFVDRESAIAKAKKRFSDFDEKLDRLFIINGEEWFGRINTEPVNVNSESFINSWRENTDHSSGIEHSKDDHNPEIPNVGTCGDYEEGSEQENLAATNEESWGSDATSEMAKGRTKFSHSDSEATGAQSSKKISYDSKFSRRDSQLSTTSCSTVVANDLQSSGGRSESKSQTLQIGPICDQSSNRKSAASNDLDEFSLASSALSSVDHSEDHASLDHSKGIDSLPLCSKDTDSLALDSEDANSPNHSKDALHNRRNGNLVPEDEDLVSSGMATLPSYQTNVLSARQLRSETRLHKACKSPKIKVKDLNQLLKAQPKDTSTFDNEGRLPLHTISCNHYLLFGREHESAQLFIDDLIKEHPDAIITRDDKGFIPFSCSINDWINDAHGNCFETAHFFNSERNLIETLVPKIVHSDPLMEWSFKMLSEIFTRLETEFSRKMGPTSLSLARIHSPAQQFLEEISSITLLIKTCLLIGEDTLRCRIFAYSFMKRLLLRKKMVGKWLVVLLSNADTSSRAIEYFEEISNLTAGVALGIAKPKITDIASFHNRREELILEISTFDYILPALFLLNEQDMQRACSTYPVLRILELSMLDPSLLGLMVFDLALHLLLIVTYHAEEIIFLRPNHDSFFDSIFCTPFLLSTLICLYLLVREEGSHYVLVRSCVKKFKSLSIWDVIGIIAICLVLVTNVMMLVSRVDTPLVLFASTKLLIWIKLLGFLKGINLHLTMFIESLGRILYGMRWFLVVTALTIMAFADMMHLALYELPGVCSAVEEAQNDLIADYCSSSLLKNAVRAYSIFVGDVGLDDYRMSPLTTFLWCIYMFVGVLMLLNVLIAIITDSYSKSFSQRYILQGRARIPVLAKHSYFNTETRQLSERGYTHKYCIVMTGIIFFYIIFAISFAILLRGLIVLVTTPEYDVSTYIMISLSTTLFLVATLSLMIVIKDFFHINLGASEKHLTKWMIRPIMPLVRGLLGVTDKEERALYKENELAKDDILPSVKEMIENSELRIKREIKLRLKRQESKISS